MDDIFKLIDKHLREMDKQPEGKDFFFLNKKVKERYESYLMHSFRCWKAANYHKDNIKNHKKELLDWAEEMKNSVTYAKSSKIKNLSASFKMNKSVDHFAYELFAFVSAIKSSLDFLLTATHFHLMNDKKERAIGIGEILGFVDDTKKSKKPHADKLNEYIEWLKYLNEYRNCLLHRSSLILEAGFEYWEQDVLKGTEVFPVTLPKSPPNFILDTRMLRAFHGNNEHKLDKTVSSAEVTYTDGTKKLMKHNVTYKPAADQIEIELFIEDILINYKAFITSYLGDANFLISK